MEKHQKLISFLVFIVAMLILNSCEKENQSGNLVRGRVKNMVDDEMIHPAFLILGDELLTITDVNGTYEITSLGPGIHSLVCSAFNYGDKIMQVQVEEGNVIFNDFLLSPDDSKGRIYGELHDQTLFDEQLIVNPSMDDWNEKELFDGVSGATIQTMTFGLDLPASEIYIGDSLFSVTDGFGQYWFDIQSGTYPLMISSIEYKDTMKIVKVDPDSRIFSNFILVKD